MAAPTWHAECAVACVRQPARGAASIRHRLVLGTGILIMAALVASATHLPHLPQILLGLHPSLVAGHATMLEQALGAAVGLTATSVAAEQPSDEVWCSVEGLVPDGQPLLVVAASVALLGVALVVGQSHRPPRRTKPPPLAGARLRATFQVFRN